jgi:hypothetical protein
MHDKVGKDTQKQYKCPRVLYKYMVKERWKDIIENGKIRFTQPIYLNDPFECSPNIRGILSKEQSDEVFEKILEEELRKFLGPIPLSYRDETYKTLVKMVESNKNNAKTLYETTQSTTTGIVLQAFNKFISENGILCLTQRNKNLLMWSHYAHEHTGLVIGFKTSHKCIDRRDNHSQDFYHPRKVVYSNEKARPSSHFGDIDFQRIFLTKSKE